MRPNEVKAPTASRVQRADTSTKRLPFGSVALFGAVALGLALRVYGIVTESIWLDEATSLMLARMDVASLVQWTAIDIHPPFYYLLLHYWIMLGESDFMVRALSALVGALNIVVIYHLGRTWFDERTGLIAALLLAVAPFHIWYSQETRMYALLTSLVSSSILLAIKFWQGRRWITWVSYVLVTIAALYTHYYALFGLLLANLFFLYLVIRRRVDRRLFWAWAGAQAALLLLFLPWIPILLPLFGGGGGWITLGVGKPSITTLAHTAILYMIGTAREIYPPLLRRLSYLLFVALFSLGLWPRHDRAGAVAAHDETQAAEHQVGNIGFCLAYLILPLGSSWLFSQIFKPMYSTRYVLPFIIPFLILVARGVRNLRWPSLRWAAMLALVILMGMGIVLQVTAVEKPDWRGLAADLIECSQEGDLVMFLPGWHAKPFDRYARGELETFSDIPVPVARYGDDALAIVADAISGHPRVWFVWETGHYTDPNSIVYHYLNAHCRAIEEEEMPLLGRVILFENLETAGGS
jgi:4-amino-4-deoxy-L-arabinose transferase-like glycosyltransferase